MTNERLPNLTSTRQHAIFVGGTTSHAGKSWMATAICAWLRERGHRVAPFKAQNMSNNSYACPGGGEIGRAQVAQAEACGLGPETGHEPHPAPSPTPIAATAKWYSRGACGARFRRANITSISIFCWTRVLAAYGSRLAARFDYVVIEGAGSVAEMNLNSSHDLCNLGLARRLNAPGLLVADIDRGGVFAAIVSWNRIACCEGIGRGSCSAPSP